MVWPGWWQWELDFSSTHLAKRMLDRFFNETDLREMLQQATAFEDDEEPGRFAIHTMQGGRPWKIIVEPDAAARRLKVVTAFWIGPIPDPRK